MIKFGSSLLVPSVQELAKQPITKVPDRYLRPNEDDSPVIFDTTSLPQIPIIDLIKLLSEDANELERLDHACKKMGVFPGVQDFFSLPTEEKKPFWQTPEDSEGYGHMHVRAEDQKLDWSDMCIAHTLPLHIRNPQLIPCFPQLFRESLENYSLEMKKLCITMIERMTKALKIDPNEVLELFKNLSQSIKWNYYSPCPQPENVIGLKPHADVGAITILLQVNETEGLQIKNEGKWIPVKPIADAFLINVGNTLEIKPKKRIQYPNTMIKFGSSLSVPSVQELAKQPITKVPEQYLRPNEDSPVICDTTSLPQIPIIDLSKLLSEDANELEKLDLACKEWGFFQLINHGVNPTLVENVKKGVQEFFSLPMEEKKPFWQTPEDSEGYGQMFVGSDDQKLDWADMLIVHTLPLHIRNPRLIPRFPQPFRENLENYSLELGKLCITIIERMTKALKIDPNEVLELFENLSQAMRWNYYPPCPQPENVIGIEPHSDAGALTILLQLNETEGLQIKNEGKWIPVKPIADAFVINVGDTLEILTNGIYPSIEHRATINSIKERISIATFHRPPKDKVIGEKPKGRSLLDLVRIQNEIDE
ncbi:hypothetical protein Fmac_003078 [Flemingia macrophylla]|uniref:Fe2OG dioxygenase domain-containing protein n=1 Tax=Flemingia macrophylla TaxID=520843 RepID=A0ABD1NLS6_9FABA